MDSLNKLQHHTVTSQSFLLYLFQQFCTVLSSSQTFRDFLIWHNNLDVQPFCDSSEKMCTFWKEKNINMLRKGISISGATLSYFFTTLEFGILLSLFDKKTNIFTLY